MSAPVERGIAAWTFAGSSVLGTLQVQVGRIGVDHPCRPSGSCQIITCADDVGAFAAHTLQQSGHHRTEDTKHPSMVDIRMDHPSGIGLTYSASKHQRHRSILCFGGSNTLSSPFPKDDWRICSSQKLNLASMHSYCCRLVHCCTSN